MNSVLSGLLWAALTGASLLVMALPRPWELALGRALGRLFLKVDPKRRRVGWDNIRRCLPELGESGWRALLRQNYEHYGVLALELLHIFSPVRGHWRAYCERNVVIENAGDWQAIHARAGRSIIVVAHTANWEMMGAMAGRIIPITMAVRKLKPDWLNDRITAARSAGGRTAFGKRILPQLLRELKEGHAIGLVFDQYAPPPMGVPALFFGVKVDTQAAISLLVQRTGAAVVPVSQRRDERGVIRVRFGPEIVLTPEELADPVRSTERVASSIEAAIRAAPAQWLWIHRRFKNVSWPDE